MNKKIMSIAITGLLGVSLLSVGLAKNNVFASRIYNKTKVEISKEDAMKLVLNQYKGGKVQKVKLDDEDGKLIYEVDVVVNGVEHDIDIDANSGKILKDEIDDEDSTQSSEKADNDKEVDENKEQANLKQLAKITVDQAKSIVMDKYKDGVIKEVDLEDEDGNIVYEVEVNSKDGEHDIKIDAQNGKILIDELDD